MDTFSFPKKERLKRRKLIGQLFARQGHSFAQYPLRVVFMPVHEGLGGVPIQVGVSVPKKKFKPAVQRNRLRRRIREAYRLHKPALLAALPAEVPPFACMFLYSGQEELPYAEIEKAMRKIIEKLPRELRRMTQTIPT